MRALKVAWGHAWQPASFETGLPIPFHGSDGARTRNLCQQITASINSTIRLRQCPSSSSLEMSNRALANELLAINVASVTDVKHNDGLPVLVYFVD